MRRLTAPIAGMLLAVGGVVGGVILYQLDEGIREPEAESTEPWDRTIVALVEAEALEEANLWAADLLCRHPLDDAGARPDFTCATAPSWADAAYLACCVAETQTFSVPFSPTGSGTPTHYGTGTQATESYAAALHVRMLADAQVHGRMRAIVGLRSHPCQALRVDAGPEGDAGPDPCADLPVPLVQSLYAMARDQGLFVVYEDEEW
jgi:hypothetical protein